MIPFDFDDHDEPASSPTGDAESGRASGRWSSRRARDDAPDVDSRDLDDVEDEDRAYDEDAWDDEGSWDDEDDDESSDWTAPSVATATSDAGASQHVHQYLVELSKDELVALIERMAAQDVAVRQALSDQVANARGPTRRRIGRPPATLTALAGSRSGVATWPPGGSASWSSRPVSVASGACARRWTTC